MEKPPLLSLVPVKRLEAVGPILRLFNVEQGIFKVGEQPVDSLVKTPEQDRGNHISSPERCQNQLVHRTKLYGSRGSQQHAKNDQVVIEAGNALLGNHVEMPKRAVVLIENGHLIFLHNSQDRARL